MNNIKEEIIQILIEYSLIDQESDLYTEKYSDSIEEIDSISYISILASIEDHFDINLPDEALTGNALKNISLLEQLVRNNLPIKLNSTN